MKISFISLGCAKNLVDSEYVLGLLKEDKDNVIIDDVSDSDAIFINTCGFINDAKKEAIDTIFDVVSKKRKEAYLIVIGCLAKRYKQELLKDIPEIDLVVGVDEYGSIGEKLNALFKSNLSKTYDPLKRSLSNPLPVAYLKIGEGCSNRCSYCAIPLIRGDFYSYKKEIIIEDAKRLISLGKKEITVIAQDPTRYGKDIYSDYGIEELMIDLLKLDSNTYYRVLYLYPDRISDKLIEVFKTNKNLLPYFDIPIQHASNHMLALMNRSGTKEKYLKVIHKIKDEVPNAILRTTVMVGFPEENSKDFNELIDFIKEIEFDHLGGFIYSKEEDTKGYSMPHQVNKLVSKYRLYKLMKIQKMISLKKNFARISQIHDVMIENFDGQYYYGRSYIFASDDIDGKFYIKSKKELIIGEIYKVKIIDVNEYDVIGEIYETL